MKALSVPAQIAVCGCLLTIALCQTADSKTIVILDIKQDAMGEDTEEGYLSNMEGFTRGEIDTTAGDLIFRGGDFTAHLSHVADGDTVIIISHGLNGPGGKGFAFTWDGQQYTGFGAGGEQMPVPANFNQRKNVTVKFRACYSSNDPDGTTGGDVSLTKKILHAMGDDPTNTATGFKGLAQAPTDFSFGPPTGFPGTLWLTYQSYVMSCLADSTWEDLPPKNRSTPPPDPNQESKALEQIQACFEQMPAGHILQGYPPPTQITLEYGTPKDIGNESIDWRGWVEVCGETTYTIEGAMFINCFELGDTSGWSSEN